MSSLSLACSLTFSLQNTIFASESYDLPMGQRFCFTISRASGQAIWSVLVSSAVSHWQLQDTSKDQALRELVLWDEAIQSTTVFYV